MTKSVRATWAKYFKENNINYVFFSALKEKERHEKELLTYEEKVNIEKVKEEIVQMKEEEFEEESENIFNQFKKLEVEYDKEDNETEITLPSSSNKEEKNIVVDDNNEEEKIIGNNMNNNTTELNKEDVNTEVNINDNIISDKKENKIDEEPEDESIKIYNREELIRLIQELNKGKETNRSSKGYYVGFIGYPNVGKSSVINVLMTEKKVK
jgi:large subunit GTPase 1